MFLTKKLWIIEDMIDLQPVYKHILEGEQLQLTFFKSFTDFKKAYTTEKNLPDLIIADIMLEDGHFFKLLNESNMTLSTSYLVISASDDLETIKNAFHAGAIDYLLKPFNQNEVRAKIDRHIMNIEERGNEASKSLEALNIDLTQLTNKEIKIIESFNLKEDKILHRNEIVKLIWKNISIHPNTLDVHIYNLRKKLKPFGYGVKAVGNGLFKFTDSNTKETSIKDEQTHSTNAL